MKMIINIFKSFLNLKKNPGYNSNGNSKLSRSPVNDDGRDNIIDISDRSTIKGTISIAGNNNYLKIDSGVVFRGNILIRGDHQKLTIGKNTTFQSVYILCQEGCNIKIGDWCMFSRNIEIRTTDAHSVIDVTTRKRINQPASITIGNHVWVGVGSLISKGATIPGDSIVGAYSFVNKKFMDENVLIAGTPAKVVKHGVTWNRGRKPKFSKAQLEHWKEPPSKTE